MPTYKAPPTFSKAFARASRRPSRTIVLGLLSLLCVLAYFVYKPDPPPPSPFYNWHPPAAFPPLAPDSPERARKDFCSNFPSGLLNHVQVVLRTGTSEHERLQAQLETVSSCIDNLIIVSDYDEVIDGRQFVDVLKGLPASYAVDNPDFDRYKEQNEAKQRGEEIYYTEEGWRLDRFKFLPMVEKAYELQPKADWYIFLEIDTYIFWDTMFRLLSQYKPSQPHLIGAPVPGSRAGHFSYGGAGIVMSRGLMKQYIKPNLFDNSVPSVKYEEWARTDGYGDITLANVIFDRTGVTMKRLWPTFNGEELIKVQVDRRTWCVPLIAMHRLSGQEMYETWEWERTRYDDGVSRALCYPA